jgi:hypothetical protein
MLQRVFLATKLVAKQIRSAGLPWVWQRAKREWLTPTTGFGRSIYSGRMAFHRDARTASAKQNQSIISQVILFAFYDLSLMPVTFDFLWFLVGADSARRRAGLDSVHVVIVPGPENGLRQEDPKYEQVVTPDARKARVTEILVAGCSLLPRLSGFTVASSREQASLLVEAAGEQVFPGRYRTEMPRRSRVSEQLEIHRRSGEDIAVLRATAFDLAAVDRFLSERAMGRRLVTITLREYDYMPARNSNLNAWAEFAAKLDPSKYAVVFVRDTDRCFDPPPPELAKFTRFDAAAVKLGLRMALYERAYLNLGVNNGPMGLCWLNANTHYLTFKILTSGAPQTTVDYMRFLGFEIDRSLPFASSSQKWIWEDDDTEIIAREFAAMEKILA